MKAHSNRNPSAVTRYIAGKVTALRTGRGWSQEASGEHCNLSKNQIGQIERGNNCPGIETCYALCLGFGVSLSEFFKDFEGDKSS